MFLSSIHGGVPHRALEEGGGGGGGGGGGSGGGGVPHRALEDASARDADAKEMDADASYFATGRQPEGSDSAEGSDWAQSVVPPSSPIPASDPASSPGLGVFAPRILSISIELVTTLVPGLQPAAGYPTPI